VSSDRQRSKQSLRLSQNQPPWYQPLRQRNYRLFLALVFTGSVGVWMQRLAQDWLVLQLTGSPAAVGVAVALQFLPMLVVGPLSGLLVDLFPKRRVPGRYRPPRHGSRRVGRERDHYRLGGLRQLRSTGGNVSHQPARQPGVRQ
jgi:hypothetical protein